jgi:hypothetical protein
MNTILDKCASGVSKCLEMIVLEMSSEGMNILMALKVCTCLNSVVLEVCSEEGIQSIIDISKVCICSDILVLMMYFTGISPEL